MDFLGGPYLGQSNSFENILTVLLISSNIELNIEREGFSLSTKSTTLQVFLLDSL